MPNTTTDLYTTVKNVSGKTLTFGFLGAHGKALDNNATFTVPGDLVTKLGSKRSQRQFQALERALTGGLLDIVKSPSVYLLSDTGNVTRELAMSSTKELGTTVPSFDGGVGAQLDYTEGDLNANDPT
jgi:hypothetical protein